ncbi:MAG: serine/threonine protein kinase [Alphaproteobacteria bacterium]|nr:serine/threonine protein kinase [Alphaproteobacteria bacterium]
MALEPGTQVGSYEVLDVLGSGGMASVYRAKHVVLGSEHALKVLRSDLVANAGIRQRFLDEGRVQAQLKHPGIVRVTDLVSEPGVAGLVMDLLKGEPLDDALRRGALSVEQAAGWMLQVLGAVGYAHGFGIVHRDLKPSNLFVAHHDSGRRSMRVLDFGIAKVTGKARTLIDETVGTYAYMSPEQIKNASAVDKRSDVFALGAVLYEMVTGHPAFEGDSDFVTMQKIASGTHTPLAEHGANVPPSLEGAIKRALELDPAARFQDCSEFAKALEKHARPEDLMLLEDWRGVEAPAPVLLGGGAAATWNGLPIDGETMSEQVTEAETLSDAPTDDAATLADERTLPSAPGSATIAPRTATPVPKVEIPEVLQAEVVIEDEPLLPAKPRTGVDRARSHALAAERHEVAVRVAGAAQVLAGLLNTFALWMVMCWGLPWVFSSVFALIGLPDILIWMSWFASFLGCGLLIIGPIEILTGLRAVMVGADARRGVQRTAILELVAVGMGGLPSFLVGLAITGLLLALPPPMAED